MEKMNSKFFFFGLLLLLITFQVCSESLQKKIVGECNCITIIEEGKTYESVMTIKSKTP